MVYLSSIRLCRERFETMGTIQHSSNFRDSFIREVVATQEMLFARLQDSSVSSESLASFYLIDNTMAKCWDDSKAEVVKLKQEVERLKTLNNNQAKMLWRNVNV